jgi:very-short-patch-repair endonuclease
MPVQRTNPLTISRSKELRHELTPAERKLWGILRNTSMGGHSFRRQHAIGRYITDFCCIKRKLVIEVDGCQHLVLEEYDKERTAYLQSRGYRVLRFWNDEVVKKIDGVVEAINIALNNEDG